MNWEVSLLLGFLLLFSAWVSFPLTDQHFFIDSNGIKHHILTPEISDYDNVADNLTNILFTRYENPWMEYAGINVIFVAGIFITLPQEPVRLYLRNRTWALVPVNLEKYLHSHLQNESKDLDLGYWKTNNDLSAWHSLIFFISKRLNKSPKVFFIIFSLLILFSFDSQNVYAATAEFVDGSQFTGLSTNCAPRSTVATLNTSLPAASSLTPNIIIATTDYVSSDGGSEQVQTSSGVYRSGSQLVGSEYTFFIDNPNEGNHYTYLYEDPIASSNPTYTVEGCLSASAGNAESKILVIQGLESSFTDSGNVATTAGSFVTIATLSTDLTANDHIIITQIQIDFDSTATIAPGNVELRDSADTMLAENQFEITGASAGIGDGSAITLIAVVTGGSVNTSYHVAVQEPVGGGVVGAEAKILALKANGGEEYFSDGGSVSVASSATLLTSLTSSFSNDEEIVVLSASQFDDTDTASETLDITSGHEIREDSVAKSGNQMAIGELAVSGNAGEGIRHTLIWFDSVDSASMDYESRADASDTGYNGESKLLAFSIQENLFPTDTPSISESVTLKQSLFPTDTPSISESVTLKQSLFPTDTPSISDSVTLKQKLFPTDNPSIGDFASAQKKITNVGGSSGVQTPPSIVSSTVTLLDTQNLGLGVIIGADTSLENLSQSRPIKVGQEINLRFELDEPGGIDNIEHSSLYIGKGNQASEISQSSTFIRFEKGKPFEINDPDKIFSDVSFAILTKDATRFVLRFDMTFAKPMEPSSILFRTWDLARNSDEIWYQNALEIVDNNLLSVDLPQGPNQESSDKNGEIIKKMNSEQKLLIEKWTGYDLESISDSKLLRLLGVIPQQTGDENKVTIPPWFRNNVGRWLLEEKITFTEFVDALEYMNEKGIL